MTNREKYKEEILDIACKGNQIAIRKCDGKLVECSSTLCCAECGFRSLKHEGCASNLRKWCNAEYKPSIDWSKVEVDTPILVSSDGKEWYKRYFSRYKNGKVFAWLDGRTSWSVQEIISKCKSKSNRKMQKRP